jgi:PAS domain S-box-containing protein
MIEIDFKKITGNMPDPIALVTTLGKVKYMNKVALEIIGKTLEEIENKDISKLDFIEKESLKEMKTQVKMYLTKGKVTKTKYDVGIIDKNGQTKTMELNTSLLKEGIRKGMWMVSLRDLTEQRKMQEKERKYKEIFEKMLNGFVRDKAIFNKAGKMINYKFLEVNKSFEELTGLKRENIIGKKITEVF